ncbi:MAG TPA: hypothetical protein ENI23_04350 [bacterium]|nr:hypothetical protein [bacterium]
MKKVEPLIFATVIVRVLISISILFYPLEAVFLSIVFDLLTTWPLAWTGLDKKQYHQIDKSLDLIDYLFLIIVTVNTPIAIPASILLGIRLVGHIAFYIKEDSRVFIFFPNVFYFYVLLYLLIERFAWDIDINAWYVWIGLILFKLVHEAYIHIFPLDIPFKVVRKIKNEK